MLGFEIAMILLVIVGLVWIGIKLEHPISVPVGYIIGAVILILIVSMINENASVIILVIALTIPLIAAIVMLVRSIIMAKEGIQYNREENQRNKEITQRNSDLFDAVNNGDKKSAKKLLEEGANADYLNVLQIAIEKQDKEIVSLLIENEADVNAICDGKTMLECAKDDEIKEILRSHGAKTKDELNDEAISQFNLGCRYFNGDGVAQDYEKAFDLFKKTAEMGLAAAQNNLGVCYLDGTGTVPNHGLAFKWFKEAAEQGYASAQNSLGMCYKMGWGVKENYRKAVEWLEKAVNQGDVQAQYNLGNYYMDEANGYKAEELWKKAAEQGYAPAQYNLALSYYKVFRKAEAVQWWKKAAEQGDVDALNRLNELQNSEEISDFSYRK